MTSGELLRDVRKRHRVSQAELAIRAGTTQSAISRIERDRVSPSVETLRGLLSLFNEELRLISEAPETGTDITLNQGNLRFSAEDRVRRGMEFADQAREIWGGNEEDRALLDVSRKPGPTLVLPPILRALVANGVDFVIVGGVAGLARGSAYATYDLDVAYARDPQNLGQLAAALAQIGVSLRNAPPDLRFQPDVETLAAGSNFTFSTPYGDFDVLGEVEAVGGGYEALRSAAGLEEVAGYSVRVASIDHLIAMNRGAGRVKDRLKLIELIDLADELKSREVEGD